MSWFNYPPAPEPKRPIYFAQHKLTAEKIDPGFGKGKNPPGENPDLLVKMLLIGALAAMIIALLLQIIGPTAGSALSSDISRSIESPAEASLSPAKRLNPPPVVILGLNGLPQAPYQFEGCEEATWYRIQAGLPKHFDDLTYRESRCTNTPISSTGCCVGYLQLSKIIFRDHRMIDRIAECQATWFNIRGDDALSKQRQMCVAKVLYDVAGLNPWRL